MRRGFLPALVFIFFALFFSATASLSETFLVPDHYKTLQEAVKKAKNNDYIIVAPGEYRLDYGNIILKQEFLSLKSTHGPEYTVIIGKPDTPVITVTQGSQAVISGFTITTSQDEDYAVVNGGAIFCDLLSKPVIMNNIIKKNRAVFGGAIYCDNRSSPSIHHNEMINNFSHTSGGAIFVNKSSPYINSNRFIENVADNSGGAIFCNRDTARIYGNIFWKNRAKSGGALGSERGAASVINNTMVENSAVFGGGIMVDGGPIRMINLILWKNKDDIYYTGFSPFSKPAYSNISDGDFRGTNGNISIEPLFTDPDNGNFKLKEDSPCIDQGNPEPIFFDLDGTKNNIGAYGGPRAYTEQ